VFSSRLCTAVLVLAVSACSGSFSPRASVAHPPPTPSAVPAAATPPATARPVPVRSPAATPRAGSRQRDLTNQARVAAGLKPLAWSSCLAAVASRHASEMAAARRIFHGQGVDQDLACDLGTHRAGENVGETSAGIDDQRIFTAFMNSSGHRANILGQYRFIGTAWVVAGRTGYVSVEFG
jgi:uncharacterized protein YkwD